MVSGAQTIELINGGETIRYTVADTQAISKNDLLSLGTIRKASGAALIDVPFAGVAAADKEASDGSTTISAHTRGIFDCLCSGAVPVGAPVKLSGANTVAVMLAADIPPTNKKMGRALETGADAEVIAIEIGGA